MSVRDGAIDTEPVEPDRGGGQHRVEDEVREAPRPAVDPRERRIEAVACRCVEVGVRDVEGQHGLRRRRVRGERSGESVEAREVRHHVGDRRAGRHHAMLDPQVRRARVVESDQRTVPAPDRPVVQPQVRERRRIVVERERQHRRKQVEVLAEVLRERPARVAGAEVHARHLPAIARLETADADGLLEERHAGLVPEIATEQERRVRRERDHRRGRQDRRVVVPRGVVRRDLEMRLERRRPGLQHHVEVLAFQTLPTVDREPRRTSAPLPQHLLVERPVARHARHVAGHEVGIAQRREDADGDGRDVHRRRDGDAVRPRLAQLGFERVEPATRDRLGRHVEFDVEAREFRHDGRPVGGCEESLVHRRRRAVGMHEPRFEFESGHGRLPREPTFGEPRADEVGLGAQAAFELLEVALVEVLRDDLLTHEGLRRKWTVPLQPCRGVRALRQINGDGVNGDPRRWARRRSRSD